MFEIINRPEDMKPSRSPIHFTTSLKLQSVEHNIFIG